MSRLDDLERQLQAKRAKRREARDSRAAREDRLEQLQVEAEQAQEQVRAHELVPGRDTGAAVAQAERRAAEIETEIEELREVEEKARAELKEAEAAYQEQLRKEVPRQAEDLVGAIRAYRGALRTLGESALETYADEVLEADEAVKQERASLKAMIQRLENSHADRPVRELKSFVSEELRDIDGRTALGFLLLRTLAFSRHAEGAIADAWIEAGPGPKARSILHVRHLTDDELWSVAKEDPPRLPLEISF